MGTLNLNQTLGWLRNTQLPEQPCPQRNGLIGRSQPFLPINPQGGKQMEGTQSPTRNKVGNTSRPPKELDLGHKESWNNPWLTQFLPGMELSKPNLPLGIGWEILTFPQPLPGPLRGELTEIMGKE